VSTPARVWTTLLAAATAALQTSPEPCILAESLRLAWSTAAAVTTTGDVHDGLWWLQLTETVAALATQAEPTTGTGGVGLGTGPAPTGRLTDTPALRQTLSALIATLSAVLTTPPRPPAGRTAAAGQPTDPRPAGCPQATARRGPSSTDRPHPDQATAAAATLTR
jgi:hypothetical protein